MKSTLFPRGQGALEVMLLMGGAVLITTIVLVMLISTPNQQNQLISGGIDQAHVSLTEAAFGDSFGPKIVNFIATPTGSGIQLSWTTYEGNTPVQYLIARQENANAKLIPLTSENNFYLFSGNGVEYAPLPDDSTSFLDSYFLVKGNTYYYKLLACDASVPSHCNVSTIPSALYTGNPSDTTPPDTPTAFASVSENAHVDLSWNASLASDVTGYRLFRAIVENGIPKASQSLLTLPAGTLSYTDTPLTNGVEYTYTLTAVDGSGNESGMTATTSTPAAVLLGTEETVYDATSTLGLPPAGCGTLDVPDTAADAFKEGSTIHLYSNFYNSRRMTGSSFSTLTKDCFATTYPIVPTWFSNMSGVQHPSGWDPDYMKFNDEEWLSTPYSLGGGNVYMLVHNEFHPEAHDAEYDCYDTKDCQPYTTVTSAFSTDGGKTFTQDFASPGFRVATLPNSFTFTISTQAVGFGGHSNIIRNSSDGYYYSMVHIISDPGSSSSGQGLCLIRTPSPLTKDSKWKGYSGGSSFNADLGGIDHCTPIGNTKIGTMHDSLTYNTHFSQYMLVGAHGQWVDMGNGAPQLMTGIYYSLSPDLINWGDPVLIAFAKMPWTALDAPGVETLSPLSVAYPAIIDHDSSDPNFNTADETAYLYVSLGNPGTVTTKLVRYPITFK